MFRSNGHFGNLKWRDKVTIILVILIMLLFLAVGIYNSLPVFSFIAPAYAAEPLIPAATLLDTKAIINLAIMGFVLIAGTVSVYIIFFSKDPVRVQTANDYLKMILGFLLGAAKSFLGA